jgi:hypothetical protein
VKKLLFRPDPGGSAGNASAVAVPSHTGFDTAAALERRTLEALKNVTARNNGERRNRID